MHRCIFCQFMDGTVSCTKSYENERVSSFVDWNHLDGVHIVVYTKKHIGMNQKDVAELEQAKQDLRASVPEVIRYENLDDTFRIIDFEDEISIGQDEEHIHLHITGKRK